MGNSQSTPTAYCVEIENSTNSDCTPVYRSATVPDVLVDNLVDNPVNNEWEILVSTVKKFPDRPFVGYRPRIPETKALVKSFSWITYKEIHDLVLCLGTNIKEKFGEFLKPKKYEEERYEPAQSLTLIGIFSCNRPEWFLTEFTCAAFNWALVPFYDSLSLDNLVYILNQTQLEVMCCSIECLDITLESNEKTNTIKIIFYFPSTVKELKEKHKKAAEQQNVRLISWEEIMKPVDKFAEPTPGSYKSVNTLCYTSGTTGVSKGVILTNGNIISCISGIRRGPIQEFLFLNENDVTISYLPLAHVLERLVCCLVISIGAGIGVYSGSNDSLIEDIQLLNPTVFVSVPRLYYRIIDAVHNNVSQKAMLSRFLFSRAKSMKLSKLRHKAVTTSAMWDPIVFDKVRKIMGNRLRYMISGGASLDPIIQDHVKVLFCVPLLEGYGLTETAGPSFLASTFDPNSGHVGGVVPCIEFKICSEPSLNYFATDPNPRGELLLRGPAVFPGYFLDPENTDEILDSDGWFHTGDIAVLLPNKAIKIIDRKKYFFKLSQGEYVSSEKLENIYNKCSLIAQIFVTGNSSEQYLVAIVIPDEVAVEAWCQKTKCSLDDKKTNEKLKEVILQEMNTIGTEHGIKGFERVKRIHIDTERFTPENDLLTPTLKIKRFLASKKYAKEITEMYRDIRASKK